jgi:hypothetical protein
MFVIEEILRMGKYNTGYRIKQKFDPSNELDSAIVKFGGHSSIRKESLFTFASTDSCPFCTTFTDHQMSHVSELTWSYFLSWNEKNVNIHFVFHQ